MAHSLHCIWPSYFYYFTWSARIENKRNGVRDGFGFGASRQPLTLRPSRGLRDPVALQIALNRSDAFLRYRLRRGWAISNSVTVNRWISSGLITDVFGHCQTAFIGSLDWPSGSRGPYTKGECSAHTTASHHVTETNEVLRLLCALAALNCSSALTCSARSDSFSLPLTLPGACTGLRRISRFLGKIFASPFLCIPVSINRCARFLLLSEGRIFAH